MACVMGPVTMKFSSIKAMMCVNVLALTNRVYATSQLHHQLQVNISGDAVMALSPDYQVQCTRFNAAGQTHWNEASLSPNPAAADFLTKAVCT